MRPRGCVSVLPTMIGFVPRTRPTITVQQYDPGRQRVVQHFPREELLEVIVGHLRRTARGYSLRELYVRIPMIPKRRRLLVST